MTPYEILLSESQERMLLVAARGREEDVRRVFSKWELDAVEIGRVTEAGELTARGKGGVRARVGCRLGARARWWRGGRSTCARTRGSTRSRRPSRRGSPSAAPSIR